MTLRTFFAVVALTAAAITGCNKKEECFYCPDDNQGGPLGSIEIRFCENDRMENDSLYTYQWEPFAQLFGYDGWDELVEVARDGGCEVYYKD